MAIHDWFAIAPKDIGLLGAVAAAVLVVSGVALTVGVFTPFCSTLLGLACALALFTPFGSTLLPRLDETAEVVALAASIAIGLIGPGAFSADARWSGRREIFIPATDS